ncbi:uncharacterized protein BXZ73DRAFT_39872 [Epithele typhae]|uniref:uncharacterized protein n=1 Tax=Epithele typhae TaxID=378194 RepID=UPI002007A4AC|nr:uncharacterized protein BXZ73DRAFT_39872 [Epithele typhae]KAH9944285.1 hypothetical protein BXZ73DRAFT_39872 [Epithele typhae]
MSVAPEPSASRGSISLQPSYFTSSLYVDPLRQDFDDLIRAFSTQLPQTTRPFELFKSLWIDQGWCWLHLRVHDGRAKQAFVSTTERVFVERLADTSSPAAQVVALLALYTFHNTQPSNSAPPTTYRASHIGIPMDVYNTMITLPEHLSEPYLSLKPHVVHVLSTQNPPRLPREIFVPDGQDALAALQATGLGEADSSAPPPAKKKGRPSKRDRIRKAKDALTSLQKYMDKNTVALPSELGAVAGPEAEVAHVVFGQAPHASLANYGARKDDLLAAIHQETADCGSQAALRKANEGLLVRLKQIDAMAAEQGLEVGGEGEDQTGLERVEKAVKELQRSGAGANGGILNLLEGAGMDTSTWSPHQSGLLFPAYAGVDLG